MINSSFQKGDLVWGKVKGYPWWPGIVNPNINRLGWPSKSSKVEREAPNQFHRRF